MRRFLREPFEVIKLSTSCQAQSFLHLRPLQRDVGGQVPQCVNFDRLEGESPFQMSRAAQNIKERPAKLHPSH
jgi:hypothetical protein